MLSDLPFVTPEDIRERAAEAIHGGEMYRDFLYRFRPGNIDMDNVSYWARRMADGDVRRDNVMSSYSHQTRVPEAAFDWPIYREAVLASALGPILYGDGPDTVWNPDTIEAVAALVPGARALARCADCGHPHGAEADCLVCEDAAGLGQHAPCSRVFDFPKEA